MKPQQTYRILEAWNDNPERVYTLDEIYELLEPHNVGAELKKQKNGLLHIVGTAFFLQPMKTTTEQ